MCTLGGWYRAVYQTRVVHHPTPPGCTVTTRTPEEATSSRRSAGPWLEEQPCQRLPSRSLGSPALRDSPAQSCEERAGSCSLDYARARMKNG